VNSFFCSFLFFLRLSFFNNSGLLYSLLPQFIRDVSTLQLLRCHGGLSGSAGDLIFKLYILKNILASLSKLANY